jgi:hypothetical protein
MMIAVFTLLVKWCLNLEAKYGLLFPGLYCFPLLMAAWGVESGLQQVRKPGNRYTSTAVFRIQDKHSGSEFFHHGSRIRIRIKEFKYF